MLGNGGNQFQWWFSKNTAPSTTPGVSVVPGSGSKGSYIELASAAELTQDCYGIMLWVHAGNTSATIRDLLIDIGTDPGGGSSYSQVHGISDIYAPQSSNAVFGGRWFWFPFFIKAGVSVGVRGKANNTSTFRIKAWFFGQPSRPDMIRAAQYAETIGVSGNGGTPFTCGNSGAEGSWTSIGTTTRSLWWWQLAFGNNVGTTTAQMYYADLAYGDGSTFHIIIENMPMFNPSTSEYAGNPLWPFCYCEVPAGATLYVRGSASGTAETTEAVAVGLGG